MRALAWFLASILLAGLIGAALAYPAYELVSGMATWAFHRVASRIAMLLLAAELVWLCRHLHLESKPDFGYGLPWRRFLKVCALWGCIGMATAGVGAAFLLMTHLRVAAADFIPSAENFARIFLVSVGSGISVALIEETVFRGVMHTAIE